MEQAEIRELYDLTHTMAKNYLMRFRYPWEALEGIGDLIKELGKRLSGAEYQCLWKGVWVHRTAVVAPTAHLGGSCVIGPGSEVRCGAYIRGPALIGEKCVVGNSVELKNVILFDRVQVPHYNYVGDSILGYHSHMGAGSITSNIKSDKTSVVIKSAAERIDTGRRKVGAMVGDWVEIGCNSVLNPGTVVGRRSSIYPLCSVRGVIPPDSIVKTNSDIVSKV